jgi:hypothetical protein
VFNNAEVASIDSLDVSNVMSSLFFLIFALPVRRSSAQCSTPTRLSLLVRL